MTYYKFQITFISLTLLFGSIFLLGSCQDKTAPETVQAPETAKAGASPATQLVELTPEQLEALEIKTEPLQQRNLKDVVRANGYLKLPPQNRAGISTYFGAVVQQIHVLEGQKVKKGQLLATLEHPDFIRMQEDYLSNRSNLAFLQQEYERQKTLYAEQVSAGKTFQKTVADYEAAKAKQASLERQLAMLGISFRKLNQGHIAATVPVVSPLNGYLSQISVNTGAFVQPGVQMFEVIDNHHLHVDLLVFEKDLFKVKEGQPVSFILTNQANREFTGKVFAVGKAFENETKSIAVHAEIKDNDRLGLIPGMFVNAIIDVGGQQVLALPEQAVIKLGEQEFIYVQQPGRQPSTFEMTPVKTGIRENGYAEIRFLNPLRHQEPVVATQGAFFIYSKWKSEQEGGGEEDH